MERALLTGATEVTSAADRDTYHSELFDVQEYWHMLWKRRIAVGLTCLAVVAVTMLASFLMKPIYRATASLQIERDNPNILSFQEILNVDARQDDFYQTQYMLLQSRSLLRTVIDRMHLYDQPEFAERLKALPPMPHAQEGWDTRLIDILQKRISIQPVARSRIVRIAVDTTDAVLSSDLANQVAGAYIDMNLETKFETTETATQFLGTQIESIKRELEADKQRLEEYAKKNRILSLDDRQNITVQRLTEVSASMTKAQTERIEAESRFLALRSAAGLDAVPMERLGDSGPPTGSQVDFGRIPEVADNSLVQSLRTTQAQLQTRHTEMTQRFKDDWPEMVRLGEQMRDLKRQIANEEWRIVAGMLRRSQADYRSALGREQMLAKELEAQRTEVSEMNSSAILYNTIKAEINNKSELLDSLLKRKNETDVSARLKGLKSSNIRIVDAAEPPVRAYRPNKKVNLLTAIVLGVILGVGLAFVLEFLDNTIKSVDDIERYVGLPSLGVIPLIPASASAALSPGRARKALGGGEKASSGRELVAQRDARSAVAESYRSLRTSILLSVAGTAPRFLLVTSSRPSEGKTTTIVNLAIALAQAGKKVLLIDADLRKPRCHRLLNLENKAGLTTFLTGAGSLTELIQPTRVENLFALTSGPIPPNPSELLGSGRVKQLMNLIPPAVNHILFDSPPVLTVTDATLLATLVDGVVLVARAGESPRKLLRRTHKQLLDVNAKILGVVLNSVDPKSHDHYSYYAYSGYHYGDDAAS